MMKSKKIKGRVIEGLKLGRKIGFPTANIEFYGKLEIKFGVYSSLFTIGNKQYKAMAYYGPRVIFDQTKPQLEVNIFNFDSEIYDAEVEVELITHMRDTMKFKTLDELTTQLKKDKKSCLEDLRNHVKTGNGSKTKNTTRTKKSKK